MGFLKNSKSCFLGLRLSILLGYKEIIDFKSGLFLYLQGILFCLSQLEESDMQYQYSNDSLWRIYTEANEFEF